MIIIKYYFWCSCTFHPHFIDEETKGLRDLSNLPKAIQLVSDGAKI